MPYKTKITKILAISSSVKFFDMLKSIKYAADKELFFAPTLAEAQRILLTDDPDIVIFNSPLTDGFGFVQAAELAQNSTCGIMVLVKEDIFEQVEKKSLPLGIFTIQKPTSIQVIDSSLRLLEASVHRINESKKETDVLLMQLEEVKLVSQAKLLLMQQFTMSENDAHRYLEKRAMSSGQTKKIIAENIIKSYRN